MKKNKSTILFLIFFFLLQSFNQAYPVNFIKKNTFNISKNKKKNVSQNVYNRINGYLNGNFQSRNLNRYLKQVAGIYMAISDDGKNSSISFCDADNFDLCAEQHLAFQTIKKCEIKSNQKCFLIFRGKIFLPNREEDFSIKNYFNVNNNTPGYHYDIHGKTLEEFNIPDD